MQRLFFLALAFIVTLGAALGVLLYVSLIPHFTEIGWAMTALLILGMICIAFMMVSFTFNKIGSWSADRQHKQLQSRVIAVGDVVAYPQIDGTLIHLSAMHEAAKIPPLITAGKPRQEEPPEEEPADDLEVLALAEEGVPLRKIAEQTGRTYYDVQKLVKDWKAKHAME